MKETFFDKKSLFKVSYKNPIKVIKKNFNQTVNESNRVHIIGSEKSF